MSDNLSSLSSVTLSAPARLHLGFLDLNGNIGRQFGSFGLAISAFETTIEAALSDKLHIYNASPALYQDIERYIADFYRTLGHHIPISQRGVALDIIATIPSHAGLGSGTQLALVIGSLLCRLHKLTASTTEIALHLGRGMRSGIGIATFDQGGFILDGGLKPNTAVPPVLFQHRFPADWRILLIQDPAHQGMHGTQEKSAFNNLPPFPTADAEKICHLTLMKLLPAIIEADLADFGDALTYIQCLIGSHFAPAQGGRFSSPAVAELLSHAVKLGHDAIAQSSWGPTGCVFVSDATTAQQLKTDLNHIIHSNDTLNHLCITITQATDRGAVLR